MYDIFLAWGNDLAVGSGGDIALVDGSTQINQRIIRRLLTNPGDYIWKLDYGGGLGLFVGSTADAAVIEAVIRTQMSLEAEVPATPVPTVSIQTLDNVNGLVSADITYADPISGDFVNLSVTTG